MSVDSTKERQGTAGQRRPAVPWLTVLSLAALLAYADGFWMTSMRGAAGAVERTDAPFTVWWRESTLALPIFVLAVLAALMLGLALFGPVLRGARAVLATALLVVMAGSVVGIAEVTASSAYDYYLQSKLLTMMNGMRGICAQSCLAQAQQASLDVQIHAVLYASGFLVVTNLFLVGWVVAIRGGRLAVTLTRRPAGDTWMRPTNSPTSSEFPEAATPDAIPSEGLVGRAEDLRLLLVAALLASAHLSCAIALMKLTEWPTGALFLVLFVIGDVAVAALLLGRLRRAVLIAAVLIAVASLAFSLISAEGLLSGPLPGGRANLGPPGLVACLLAGLCLFCAIILLRSRSRLAALPSASAHLRALVLVAVIAVTAIGIADTAPDWFDLGVSSDSQPDVGHG